MRRSTAVFAFWSRMVTAFGSEEGRQTAHVTRSTAARETGPEVPVHETPQETVQETGDREADHLLEPLELRRVDPTMRRAIRSR